MGTKSLFSDEGLKALEAFSFANTLFAFDYDGTLAPLVDEPSKAFMRKETTEIIRELSQYVPIAIISGRKREDVLVFAKDFADYVIGNHGLEGLPSGSHSIESAQESCSKWMEQISEAVKSMDGVWIENKTYSLALHYRNSKDKRGTRMALLDLSAGISPSPRIVLGKYVVNLIMPGAPHKGVALLEIMLKSGCRAAVYFGDDDNDEDVFRLSEENLLTVRIGESNDISAMFALDSQETMDSVLKKILEFVKSSKSKRSVNRG